MGKADEDFTGLSELAEKLGLDETEGPNFISSAMKRLGHKPKVSWEDSDDNGGKDGGDFFSARRKASGEAPRRRSSQYE